MVYENLWTIFWVSETDRPYVGAKYLSPTGKGLQPTLLLSETGLVVHDQINDQIVTKLKKEGIALTEGIKGALALCAAGFNVCTIGGCNGGVSVLKILTEWGIKPTLINRVFADTDILTNIHVTTGYKSFLHLCKDVDLLVYPPQNAITTEGELFTEKFSPDDWIEEGDDLPMTLTKVRKISIEAICTFQNQFAIKQKNKTVEIETWLTNQLKNRLLYISETSQYYYYFDEGYWGVLHLRTLLDQIIAMSLRESDLVWSYSMLEHSLKKVAPRFMETDKRAMDLFLSRKYIGFQNGVWDSKQKHLRAHGPEYYLSGLLPFNYRIVQENKTLQVLCPKICKWILGRVGDEEIYANILIVFLLITILDVRNPQVFLFIGGYSATGKSSFLKLLETLVPENKAFVTTAEHISGNFGLQELTGISRTLLIFHDIGSSVSASFVNKLRNLVSIGETQNVDQKNRSAAPLRFEGIVAMASNKNPFSQQQREGILDRRMIYVPFTNRVQSHQIQDFEKLFPYEELETLISFAIHQNMELLLKFLRSVNHDATVRNTLMENFVDNPKIFHINTFITRRIVFCLDSWLPLGSEEDRENFQQKESIYSTYLCYMHDIGAKVGDILSYIAFRQEFMPLIQRLNPHWEIHERRRRYQGRRIFGILNIQLNENDLLQTEDQSLLKLDEFSASPFWIVSNSGDQSPPETVIDQAAASHRPGSGQPAGNCDLPGRNCNRPGSDQPAPNRPGSGQPAGNCGRRNCNFSKI